MNDFLEFFNAIAFEQGLKLEIYYSSIVDWNISIGFKQTHPKFGDKNIVHTQDCDMKLAFAKAQVELKKWLLENNGGY